VNNAEKLNPARNAEAPGGILADGDHAIADHPLAVCWQSITLPLENQSVKAIPPSRSRAGNCSITIAGFQALRALGVPEGIA
jgi:hypothetical protein